jgi:hypothetical protein
MRKSPWRLPHAHDTPAGGLFRPAAKSRYGAGKAGEPARH